ncbi:unnamed protein product [Amoebophrya sp. A120]|nr:unnamed protein product [Amoebophrya sp. A120]|eukprot:GSA120T00007850001.1
MISASLDHGASGSSLAIGQSSSPNKESGFDEQFLSKYVQQRDEAAEAVHLQSADEDAALNLGNDAGSNADSEEEHGLNVERKLCLFQTPAIQQTLLKFWRTLLKTAASKEQRERDREAKQSGRAATPVVESSTIGMDTFLQFNILLQRVLLQEQELDLSTARASAVTDWLESTTIVAADNTTLTSDDSQSHQSSMEDQRPIDERRMTIDQFALFLFDLTVIWCHLSYSSFLFFLGTLFLHTTSADHLETVEFKLEDVKKVQPLPQQFFQMAADDFEFPTISSSKVVGVDQHADSPHAGFFEPSQSTTEQLHTGIGGILVGKGGASSSTSLSSPRQSNKSMTIAAAPHLPSSLANSRAFLEGQGTTTAADAGTFSQQNLFSAAVSTTEVFGAGTTSQQQQHTSRKQVEQQLQEEQLLHDEQDEAKQFEKWYQMNFQTEDETLLFVQRQMFEVTRDIRAVFLFPGPSGGKNNKLTNRARILELLDAAKRLQMDLEKIAPVKASALLTSVGPYNRVERAAAMKQSMSSPSTSPGKHHQPVATSPASPGKKHQDFSLIPKSLRPGGGRMPQDKDPHPFYQTQTEAAGMYFSQAKRRPDKYLVVGKVEDFRRRRASGAAGNVNMFHQQPKAGGSSLHHGTAASSPGKTKLSSLHSGQEMSSTVADSKGKRTMLVETGHGWRSGFSTTQNELPLGVPQRFGAPEFLRFPSQDDVEQWNRPRSHSPPKLSSSVGFQVQRQNPTSGSAGEAAALSSTTSKVNASTAALAPAAKLHASSADKLLPAVMSPTKEAETVRDFVARFEVYLREQGQVEEPLPTYDLPIRIPEVYSNQLKPWLATKADDILYWVKGQEEQVVEKTRKFQSIQGLPGPLANGSATVWSDMRARLARILARGEKRVERKKKKKQPGAKKKKREMAEQHGGTEKMQTFVVPSSVNVSTGAGSAAGDKSNSAAAAGAANKMNYQQFADAKAHINRLADPPNAASKGTRRGRGAGGPDKKLPTWVKDLPGREFASFLAQKVVDEQNLLQNVSQAERIRISPNDEEICSPGMPTPNDLPSVLWKPGESYA